MRSLPEHIWTLPNALTLVRVPLAGMIWAAPESRAWLFAMLAAAAVSDVLDGRVARALRARRLARGADPQEIGKAHAIGAWLDPACDKLFVLSMAAAVALTYAPAVTDIVLTATREIILVPFVAAYWLAPRLRQRLRLRFDFRAGALGKATTVAQFSAIASMVVWPAATTPLAAAAALVGFFASADYLARAVAMARFAARQQPLTYERWLEIQLELRAYQRLMRRRSARRGGWRGPRYRPAGRRFRR
jgi:cardiolipin synthase (CMP-forming)